MDLEKSPNNNAYKVESCDRFHPPGDDDAYTTIGYYESFEEAVARAREINLASISYFKDMNKWRGMGTHGLVYDINGKLVWRDDDYDD